MPFLTIITRHMPKRALMLAINRASLTAQTDQDFEQVLLVDRDERGIGWTHEQFAVRIGEVAGAYVFILDDDDKVIDPEFVAKVKQAAASKPDLIMVKMQDGATVRPGAAHWQKTPAMGHIDMSGFVVRRDVWIENVHEFRPVYPGDFTFISAVYPKCQSVVWLDCVMTATQSGHHQGR